MNSSSVTNHISFGACGTDMSIVNKCVHFFAMLLIINLYAEPVFFVFTVVN